MAVFKANEWKTTQIIPIRNLYVRARAIFLIHRFKFTVSSIHWLTIEIISSACVQFVICSWNHRSNWNRIAFQMVRKMYAFRSAPHNNDNNSVDLEFYVRKGWYSRLKSHWLSGAKWNKTVERRERKKNNKLASLVSSNIITTEHNNAKSIGNYSLKIASMKVATANSLLFPHRITWHFLFNRDFTFPTDTLTHTPSADCIVWSKGPFRWNKSNRYAASYTSKWVLASIHAETRAQCVRRCFFLRRISTCSLFRWWH